MIFFLVVVLLYIIASGGELEGGVKEGNEGSGSWKRMK